LTRPPRRVSCVDRRPAVLLTFLARTGRRRPIGAGRDLLASRRPECRGARAGFDGGPRALEPGKAYCCQRVIACRASRRRHERPRGRGGVSAQYAMAADALAQRHHRGTEHRDRLVQDLLAPPTATPSRSATRSPTARPWFGARRARRGPVTLERACALRSGPARQRATQRRLARRRRHHARLRRPRRAARARRPSWPARSAASQQRALAAGRRRCEARRTRLAVHRAPRRELDDHRRLSARSTRTWAGALRGWRVGVGAARTEGYGAPTGARRLGVAFPYRGYAIAGRREEARATCRRRNPVLCSVQCCDDGRAREGQPCSTFTPTRRRRRSRAFAAGQGTWGRTGASQVRRHLWTRRSPVRGDERPADAFRAELDRTSSCRASTLHSNNGPPTHAQVPVRLGDGQTIETVSIPDGHRVTFCISSQVVVRACMLVLRPPA